MSKKRKKIKQKLKEGERRLVAKNLKNHTYYQIVLTNVRDRAPGPFYDVLGQTHVNGWRRVIASQNGGLTSYIFSFRLRVLQWSRHLFNYWKKIRKP